MLYASSILNRYRKFILFNPSRRVSLSILSQPKYLFPSLIYLAPIDFAFANLFISSVTHPFTTTISTISLYISVIYHYNVCLTASIAFFSWSSLSSPITLFTISFVLIYNLIYVSLYTELPRRIDLFVFIVRRFGAGLANTKKEALESDSNRVRFMTLR